MYCARFPWVRVISDGWCGFQAASAISSMAAEWPAFCLGLGKSCWWWLCCFSNVWFSLMWFPCTWAILSLVTFASVLPSNGIRPQTHVGNRQSALGCGAPTANLCLDLLQFLASSLTIVFGRALFYTDGRNGNYIQVGLNSWCFKKTPYFCFSGGNLSNLHSFHTFFFFTNVDFEVLLFSCLWPGFS